MRLLSRVIKLESRIKPSQIPVKVVFEEADQSEPVPKEILDFEPSSPEELKIVVKFIEP